MMSRIIRGVNDEPFTYTDELSAESRQFTSATEKPHVPRARSTEALQECNRPTMGGMQICKAKRSSRPHELRMRYGKFVW